jgi:molybdenum cofactor biosynthesis enzyme MoaA
MNREPFRSDNFLHSDPEKRLQKTFCRVPFNEFHIYRGGFVANCCFNWLPTEIGNIHQNTLLELSENAISQEIQKSVKTGAYNFCNSAYCPALNTLLHENRRTWPLEELSTFEETYKNKLHKKIKLYLSFDYSCNLWCESCRNEKIYFDRKNAPPELLQTHDRVTEQIQQLLENDYDVEVNITGSGDAFASPLYYEMMCKLPQTNKLSLHISTNGTMMTEKKLGLPTKDQISTVFISVDSCRPESYSKLRRGGNFVHLQSNLDAFDQMVSEKQFASLQSWQLNVIVQAGNYRELGEIVDWSKRYKTLQSIFYTKILDWGHLSSSSFKEKAVWLPEHPDHADFLTKIQDPRLKEPRAILGNLSEYLAV